MYLNKIIYNPPRILRQYFIDIKISMVISTKYTFYVFSYPY